MARAFCGGAADKREESAERGAGTGVARCDGGVSWESTVRETLGVKRKTDLLLHRRWTSDERRSKGETDDAA